MYDVNKWIIAEHPNYLFGKLNLANEYYLKQEYEKIPTVLGREMELASLYPHRKTFHLNEVTSFLKNAILYYTAIEDFEQAEIRYDLMIQIAPDSADTEMIKNHFFATRMLARQKRYEEEEKTRLSVITKSQEVSTVSEQPTFHHVEIIELYGFGFDVKKGKLENIMSLPRETLIQDLELVLQDSIKRYSYFHKLARQDEWNEEAFNFVIHAIFILGELKASTSMNTIFHVLSQSDEYLELYLGDFLTEILWEPLYKIAENNLQLCKEFLFKPGVSTYSKATFLDVAEQIALHNPKRNNEIGNLFNDVIQFFLNSDINDNVIDSDLIGLMICNVLNIKGVELLPGIKEMFERGIVSTKICGSWMDVNVALSQPDDFDNRREILSIFDRYKGITLTWARFKEEESYSEFNYNDQFDQLFKPAKAKRKIGRNEPCPCGSGKKFKKCCLN